jgi:hypothetical protein
MKQLNQKQAEALRSVRPSVGKMEALNDPLMIAMSHACECDHDPDNCATCKVFSLASTVEEAIDRLGEFIDRVLLRGPEPKASNR